MTVVECCFLSCESCVWSFLCRLSLPLSSPIHPPPHRTSHARELRPASLDQSSFGRASIYLVRVIITTYFERVLTGMAGVQVAMSRPSLAGVPAVPGAPGLSGGTSRVQGAQGSARSRARATLFRTLDAETLSGLSPALMRAQHQAAFDAFVGSNGGRQEIVVTPRDPPPTNPSVHPQFRSKAVCNLFCKHCSSTLCKRGMKAILLGNTKVELYSTDIPPSGVQLVWNDYTTQNCHCRIRDAACLGCGNIVGYHVTQVYLLLCS